MPVAGTRFDFTILVQAAGRTAVTTATALEAPVELTIS
jgi:hypothetical protein